MSLLATLPLVFVLAQLPSPPPRPVVPQAALDAYAHVLRTHVKDGLVDYAGLKKHSMKELELFLEAAAKANTTHTNDQDGAAFLIDAYNALVLRAVIREGRPRSVLDVKGFFDKKKFEVVGTGVTLDQLEKKMLHGRDKSRRYHMAVVCAAVSCPILESEPYQGTSLDQRLDAATRRFLASRHGAVVSEGKVALSRIFDWYKADFGGEKGAVEFVRQHLPPETAKKLGPNPEVSYLEYNWTLNQQ